MDFDVPLPGGRPSTLHLASVANFLMPTVQDTWWTEPRVKEYYPVPSDSFFIGHSKIAGCGAIAKRKIRGGEKIGIVWVKDQAATKEAGEWAELLPRHFTPWYGRAVNHCDKPNTRLQEDARGTVYSVAIHDIEVDEEITGDYNEATRQFPHVVGGAAAGWKC